MSRWSVLKDAIVHKKRSVHSDASIHKFPGHLSFIKSRYFWKGFHLHLSWNEFTMITDEYLLNYFAKVDSSEIFLSIEKPSFPHNEQLVQILSQFSDARSNIRCDCNDQESSLIIRFSHTSFIPVSKSSRYWKYNLEPFSSLSIVTREPAEEKISVEELLSDRLFGVDNTGNVCVWPSEPLLLYVLLERYQNLIKDKCVLEIGGGVTGLIGLALSVLNIPKSVVITDGHPNCVKNQEICIEMLKSLQLISSDRSLSSMLLEWSSVDVSRIGQQDVIIGADCLFFQDFHDSLVRLLTLILSENGVVILFQPRRSGSMENFMKKAEEYFQIEIEENYSDKVSL